MFWAAWDTELTVRAGDYAARRVKGPSLLRPGGSWEIWLEREGDHPVRLADKLRRGSALTMVHELAHDALSEGGRER